MTNIPNDDQEERKATQAWLRLLWLAPWILILAFFSFHFIARNAAHRQARNNWMQDRIQLVSVYMEISVERDGGYTLSDSTVRDAHDALDHLQDDLKELSGAGDENNKKIFLEKARGCVAKTSPDLVLKQESQPAISVTPAPSEANKLPNSTQRDACATMIFHLGTP